jgi:release factor glutamine methyltransferase
VNLQSAVQYARQKLDAGNCSNAQQEARWMLDQIREVFKLHAGADTLPPAAQHSLDDLLQRRINGEPLQYLLGNTEFHCLELLVGPGVLIPRPETEILVEEALRLYPGYGIVCDLCTGSGAIALAMAKNLPQTTFMACDLSEQALHWARLNQQKNHLHNVTFFHGDLFQPFPLEARFSLLTANPPYVSRQEYAELPSVVRDYEPELALLSGEDGLDLLRRIIREAPEYLLPDAWMLLEIGSTQGNAVRDLLLHDHWREVRIRKDYAGHDRIAIARRGF